jgi:hypothetical protein
MTSPMGRAVVEHDTRILTSSISLNFQRYLGRGDTLKDWQICSMSALVLMSSKFCTGRACLSMDSNHEGVIYMEHDSNGTCRYQKLLMNLIWPFLFFWRRYKFFRPLRSSFPTPLHSECDLFQSSLRQILWLRFFLPFRIYIHLSRCLLWDAKWYKKY